MFKKKTFNKTYLNCRRGMLELDIILIAFVKIEYYNLKDDVINDFNKLLLKSDQILYSWIIKGDCCEKRYKNIVYLIRRSNLGSIQ